MRMGEHCLARSLTLMLSMRHLCAQNGYGFIELNLWGPHTLYVQTAEPAILQEILQLLSYTICVVVFGGGGVVVVEDDTQQTRLFAIN